ncbi:DUF1836 domain-containing protein [Lederbergia galactosidilytica]|uniref:DUF1836 domain-containing protein n=1 Tax=Lederbergia galactosidilytica TaxID=217031 RepID=A0A177ZTT0_9BACI|nr:DUF1836 domain-containing protein [Lederbergia galactosidilytica]KRG13214.1 hypothetical protein ACA30_16610 [Virgibacillus soli]OAK71244.1 hypothetical protein ABB05_10890 [Lederbergia galactosidilytica]
MKNIDELLSSLSLTNHISLQDIPKMDLYIDQVIELFEEGFKETKRDKKEKILTKTMVNNYAKGKLFFPVQNKKYSKEHIMLMSLIYQLKGALSIKDIKDCLQILNKEIVESDFNLGEFYESYLHLYFNNVSTFQDDLQEKAEAVREKLDSIDEKNKLEMERTLLIASLVSTSNLYRRAAEKLVDEISDEEDKS